MTGLNSLSRWETLGSKLQVRDVALKLRREHSSVRQREAGAM